MTMLRKSLLLIFFVLLNTQVLAQKSEYEIERDADRRMISEGEERRARGWSEMQMREAEERLALAARKIAELSSRKWPFKRHFNRLKGRLMLGITISGNDIVEPVEGVRLHGVSPGGAAAEAGLRSGDIITAVNNESLTADSDEEANTKLIKFMSSVKAGDVLDVEYLRDGKQAIVEVSPKEMSRQAFPFHPGPKNYSIWGHMEMITLTERLGKYFATDKGLLVVRAPDDADLKLQDGDVIKSIDGREPKSVSHAMRILGSYQSGEQLQLQIMRDKRKQTLKIEMPDNSERFMDARSNSGHLRPNR
ncbi:PDZ domain-containing protein [Woeseiaceae bacterium]|nr:PDZ domain-containing protein [Woeseiaceae bacterium]